jgi:hypothetical protein
MSNVLRQMFQTIQALSAVALESHGGVSEATQNLEYQIALLEDLFKPVEITADMVKELRSLTGEGMMSCHKALKHCSGDMQKAVDYLRSSGTLCI